VAWKATDGRLWFATSRGVAVVDPANVLRPLPAPDVQITEVLVDGQSLDREQWSAGLVRMPAGVRQLDVRYSVMRLGTPERLSFQRRLRPGDAWQDTGRERFTHLHDLRPGRYRLEVRAADIDKVWGASATLEYVVRPHFWQNGWFIGLALAVLAGVGGLAYRRRWARLEECRQAQASFARQLMDREEEWRRRTAVDLHDSFGQLLQVIRNRAVMAKATGLSPVAAEHVGAISDTAEQAVGEARDIIRSLHPHYLEQLGLTRSLHYLVTQLSQASAIAWERSIDPIDPLLPDDQRIHLYRVVQECLSNVVRHSGATKAGLVIRQEATALTVEVWDNGLGLPAAGAATAGGTPTGLGLRTIQERVHFLGGVCRFQLAPQGGLLVSIQIPIVSADHDSEDQNNHRG
jgi:signal transduction histidine kinase